MSKSADNYIGLTEEPLVMFRKVMQIDDDVIFRYFELLSDRTNSEIGRSARNAKRGRNPLEIKALFARELITRFHDVAAAEKAASRFRRRLLEDAVPDDVPTHEVKIDAGATLAARESARDRRPREVERRRQAPRRARRRRDRPSGDA